MSTYTKIVCTIGPSVDSYEKIKELAEAGMNVARLNFSHGTQESHLKTIKILKQVREELNFPLAIMLDTKGPEIRVAKVKDDLIKISDGQRFKLVKDFSGKADEIAITPFDVLENLKVGTKILFADGYLISEIVQKKCRDWIRS
jgi:pyruvate kinase